jgi:hypothetical protein
MGSKCGVDLGVVLDNEENLGHAASVLPVDGDREQLLWNFACKFKLPL